MSCAIFCRVLSGVARHRLVLTLSFAGIQCVSPISPGFDITHDRFCLILQSFDIKQYTLDTVDTVFLKSKKIYVVLKRVVVLYRIIAQIIGLLSCLTLPSSAGLPHRLALSCYKAGGTKAHHCKINNNIISVSYPYKTEAKKC